MNYNIIALFIILAMVAIPVVLGIIIYRDSKAHNMNSILWTFVVLTVPGFVGLIIYLIVRRDYIKGLCKNNIKENKNDS